MSHLILSNSIFFHDHCGYRLITLLELQKEPVLCFIDFFLLVFYFLYTDVFIDLIIDSNASLANSIDIPSIV